MPLPLLESAAIGPELRKPGSGAGGIADPDPVTGGGGNIPQVVGTRIPAPARRGDPGDGAL